MSRQTGRRATSYFGKAIEGHGPALAKMTRSAKTLRADFNYQKNSWITSTIYPLRVSTSKTSS